MTLPEHEFVFLRLGQTAYIGSLEGRLIANKRKLCRVTISGDGPFYDTEET